jgi:hypothetical protein
MAEEKVVYPQEFKTYISKLVRYANFHTYHGEYERTITWCAEPDADNDNTTIADITTDDAYLNYVINIYPPLLDFWKRKEYSKCGRYMLHEICHLFIHPVARWAREDAAPSQLRAIQRDVERQTQRIANTIDPFFPKKWWEPKRLDALMKKDGLV